MARYHIGRVALDCGDLDALIPFWSEALGYELHCREEDYAVLHDPAGTEPHFFLQRVPEPRAVKNRTHLDITVPGKRELVARLKGLGATEQWRMDVGTHYWTVGPTRRATSSASNGSRSDPRSL